MPRHGSIIALSILLFVQTSFAISSDKIGIEKKVLDTAEAYAGAIACSVHIGDNMPVKIKSKRDKNDRYEREIYAVIWGGNPGCHGGNASWFPLILTISVGFTGEPTVIDVGPKLGSRKMPEFVGHTASSIEVFVYERAPDDPFCCPSQKRLHTLYLDEGGSFIEEASEPVIENRSNFEAQKSPKNQTIKQSANDSPSPLILISILCFVYCLVVNTLFANESRSNLPMFLRASWVGALSALTGIGATLFAIFLSVTTFQWMAGLGIFLLATAVLVFLLNPLSKYFLGYQIIAQPIVLAVGIFILYWY